MSKKFVKVVLSIISIIIWIAASVLVFICPWVSDKAAFVLVAMFVVIMFPGSMYIIWERYDISLR